MKKINILLATLAISLLSGCNNNEHQHTFSEDWSFDSEMHWHEATCDHKELTSSLSGHTYNTDGVCSVCGRHKDIPATEVLKIDVENGKANASEDFEQSYALNDFATVKLTANEDCTLPEQIRVYSGNELILPATYTYVLNEAKTSADFIIKMSKSYEVMVRGIEELGAVYIGGTELTKSGDYSDLISDQPSTDKVVFSKETNTLTLNGAILKASKIGTTTFHEPKTGLDVGYLFAYTGTKPLTIELSGSNRFYLTDTTSCDFKKGLFISVNGGELNFTGLSNNYVYGAGNSIIYSNQKVTVEKASFDVIYAGAYGIFAKELTLDEANISISSVYDEDVKYEKGCQCALYTQSATINKSGLELTGFMTGIYATYLRIYHTKMNIESTGKGIDCDWFTAYGQPEGADSYSTIINVKAKTGGISSYDTQEWNYAKADVQTEAGHGIYTVDTTIYVYNSELKGVTGGKGDGIHAYRLYCVNSILDGESSGTYNAGIRCSIYSGQSHKADKQPFIYLENSYLHAKGTYGAIFGIGSIIMNGTELEEGWNDGTIKYLRHKLATNTYLLGIFDMTVEECKVVTVESGGANAYIPENPIKECTIDALYK